MKIIADSNIPLLECSFGHLGDIELVDGRNINSEVITDADILLVRSVTAVNGKLLEGSAVRFVGTATSGYDHVDTTYLRENHIGFANAPGSNARSVAEYVVTALILLCRKRNIAPQEITLGIIGAGAVGSMVLSLASALGICCILNDPPLQRICNSKLFMPLEELLARSDVVTLHVPLTYEGDYATYHMADEKFFDMLKNGAILINTSRGKVIKQTALKNSLHRLGGLAIDVWYDEPYIDSQIVRYADIATPHIAGYSFDGKIKGTEMIYHSACRYFFRDIEWSLVEFYKEENRKTIELFKSKDPLFDALTTACPIEDDDRQLRRLIGKTSEEQIKIFDELRKNYRLRREFNHYILNGINPTNDKLCNVMTTLGFSIAKES